MLSSSAGMGFRCPAHRGCRLARRRCQAGPWGAPGMVSVGAMETPWAWGTATPGPSQLGACSATALRSACPGPEPQGELHMGKAEAWARCTGRPSLEPKASLSPASCLSHAVSPHGAVGAQPGPTLGTAAHLRPPATALPRVTCTFPGVWGICVWDGGAAAGLCVSGAIHDAICLPWWGSQCTQGLPRGAHRGGSPPTPLNEPSWGSHHPPHHSPQPGPCPFSPPTHLPAGH